ncbi:hypothetical protein SAMN03159488_02848 [Pseudomonas sp. NFIX10]|nr:hypothetical protein SAMN03159488_02848 [Pseudomonas sp. NFIX10]SFE90039.1 hypothetical protein SAMN03159367_02419 [Pseudomonas sp. NFACC06-1]
MIKQAPPINAGSDTRLCRFEIHIRLISMSFIWLSGKWHSRCSCTPCRFRRVGTPQHGLDQCESKNGTQERSAHDYSKNQIDHCSNGARLMLINSYSCVGTVSYASGLQAVQVRPCQPSETDTPRHWVSPAFIKSRGFSATPELARKVALTPTGTGSVLLAQPRTTPLSHRSTD